MSEQATGIEVTEFGTHCRVRASGAAVYAVYRAHLSAFGPKDVATKQLLDATMRDLTWAEDLDGYETLQVANALDGEGMGGTAKKLRRAEAYMRAEQLREDAAALEYEADRIERVAS